MELTGALFAYSDPTFLVANATDSNTELNIFGPTHLLNTKFPGHVVNSSNKTVKNTIKQSESKLEWTNIYEGQVSTSTGHITLPEELQYNFTFFHY